MITNILYKLWQKLPEPEKKDACRAFWDPCGCNWAPLRDFALEQISFATGRPLEVLKMRPNNELAEKTLMVMKETTHPAIILNVLHVWMSRQYPATFDGFSARIRGDVSQIESRPPATEESLREGLRELKTKCDPRILALCCATHFVHVTYFRYLKHLETAVPAEGLDLFGVFTEIALNSKESTDGAVDEIDRTQFTKLDELLQITIFATESKQTNAPSPEEMEEMVEDFIKLDTSRRQSYFHRGILHATLNHPFQFQFPGGDEEKRLWYFCGVLTALKRKGKQSATSCSG